jgi:hypothetical protein
MNMRGRINAVDGDKSRPAMKKRTGGMVREWVLRKAFVADAPLGVR